MADSVTRSFVAVRQSTFPGCDPVWTALSSPKETPAAAVLAGRLVEADCGLDLGFVVAVFDGPAVVQLLDQDGDPQGWAAEDLWGIRDDIRDEMGAIRG